MNKKIIVALSSVLLILGLTGCTISDGYVELKGIYIFLLDYILINIINRAIIIK